MREVAMCRVHPMQLAISFLRDPTFNTGGRFSLVANEFADTTSGQHRGCIP